MVSLDPVSRQADRIHVQHSLRGVRAISTTRRIAGQRARSDVRSDLDARVRVDMRRAGRRRCAFRFRSFVQCGGRRRGHAADAQAAGQERRIADGCDPAVGCRVRVALRHTGRHRFDSTRASHRAVAVCRGRSHVPREMSILRIHSTTRLSVARAATSSWGSDRSHARCNCESGLRQVEADPAVVNLSAFETVFDERRPFFIEGNEMLTDAVRTFLGRPTWFYTRRSARRRPDQYPAISSDDHSIRRFSPPQKLRAASLPVLRRILAAATPREYPTFSRLVRSRSTESPWGAEQFGVLRLQQEFGRKQSNFAFQ